MRRLADRRFGVGADQILLVEPSATPGIDFRYRIFNGSGDEVEHCGNGARCFVRYVHERGLTAKTAVRVETVNNVLELRLRDDGRVTVDMNRPVFEHARVPFDAGGLVPRHEGGFELWPLGAASRWPCCRWATRTRCSGWTTSTPRRWRRWGPRIETHPRFPRQVNAGFMQVRRRAARSALRVYERGAGETLACGTGACAAVVAGIRLGWLDRARRRAHARRRAADRVGRRRQPAC